MAKQAERFMVTVTDPDYYNKPVCIIVSATSTDELVAKVTKLGWPHIESIEVVRDTE